MIRKSRRRSRIWPVWLLLLLVLAAASLIAYFLLGGKGDRGLENGDKGRQNGADLEAVDRILQEMTLEEKIGQVIIAYFQGPTFGPAAAEKLRELPLGGVILFSSAGKIESPRQVAELTAQIQEAARSNGVLPLLLLWTRKAGPWPALPKGLPYFPGIWPWGRRAARSWPAGVPPSPPGSCALWV